MKFSTVQDENLKKVKKTPKEIKIGNDVYTTVSKEAVLASRWLIELYERLGKPKSPFSEAGRKLMDVIISVWEDLYPIDAKVWHDERREYQLNELPISTQVSKHTGRSLASYPYPIFKMMKVVFPDFHPAERRNCMSMVKIWPLFRMANKA